MKKLSANSMSYPSLPPMNFLKRGFWRIGIITITLIISLLLMITVQAAPATCNTSGPGSYSVTLCIDSPTDNSTISGDTLVMTSVSVTGTNPGAQKMEFFLNGVHLVSDWAADYSFILPTAHFVDGINTLAMAAQMRDGFNTSLTSITLTFNNGNTVPPTNTNTFTPASGTTPASGAPFVLAAVGDGAGGEPDADSVNNLIASWNPNMFLYLGDVHEWGTYTEFYNWYGTGDNSFSQFRNITNPTVGNHEYHVPDAADYFFYWDNVPHYYSFDANGWHIISLDSTSQFDESAPGSPQYQWLVNDLNTNTADCTLVFLHHPRYSVGSQGNREELAAIWSLSDQHGVDLFLAGHDHNYQRWQPINGSGAVNTDGITQFVVGGGGHAIISFAGTDNRLAVGYDTVPQGYGALRLELNPVGSGFQFAGINGKTLDSGVIPCRDTPLDITPPTNPTNLTTAADTGIQVKLTWTASIDNTGVSGYTIYRDGAFLETVNGATLNYTDSTALLNTSYTYTVDAFDLAGNYSGLSNSLLVTTPTSGTLTIAPEADAYVNGANASANYGSLGSLRTDGSPDIRSYLRFNVQEVNGIVTQATLRVYANSRSGVGYTLHEVTNNTWTESGITYNTAPPVGSQIGSSGSFSSSSWTTVDVTSLITGNGDLSMAMLPLSNTAISYSSREGSNSPELIIDISDSVSTSTPTPTATFTPTPTVSATSSPGIFTFVPVADAYVNASRPDNNYGNRSSLRTDASPVKNSYMRFNVQGLAGTIQTATLRVYANTSSSVGYEVYEVTDNSWQELTLTYANAPTYSTLLGTSGTFSGDTWTTIDLTSYIAGNGAVNLVLVTTSNTATRYTSREGTPSPELVIVTSE